MGRISPKRRAFTIRRKRERRLKVRRILDRLAAAPKAEERAALLAKLQRISPLHPFLMDQYKGEDSKRKEKAPVAAADSKGEEK